jgi:WD40 repeat protein
MSCDRKGRQLAVVDYSHGRVVVLDPDEPARKMVLPHARVAGCVVSPDGRWAVTEARHGRLKAWDLSTGKEVWELPQTSTSLWGFTPDSLWLLTSSPEDNSDRLWQVGSWQPGPVIPRQQKRGPVVRPLPAGEVFMTWDSPPKLIHAATGRELATLQAPDDNNFVSAQHSPNRALLAVATGNHTVHVWDLRAIRRGLAEIGLDWDLAPYPTPRSDARPLRVEVLAAKAPPKEEKNPAPKK